MHDIDYIKRWKLLGVHSKYDLDFLIKGHEDGNIIQTLYDIGVTDTDLIMCVFRQEIKDSKPYSKHFKTLYKYIGSKRVEAMLNNEYKDIILSDGDRMKVGSNGYIWFNNNTYDGVHPIEYTYTYRDSSGVHDEHILNSIETMDGKLYLRRNRRVANESRYIELILDKDGSCSSVIREYSAVHMREQVTDSYTVYMERINI